MLPVREPETIRMAMVDGVELVADLYRPAVAGTFPVLVLRLPYGRKVASAVVLAHPAWYAAQGYLVLVQDVRGRGDSQGSFRVLEDEPEDGARTMALAADLAGGNGQVASYGFSYHGMNQFMGLAGAIRAGTRRPDAMAVIMAAWDVRNHWAYEGDAFRLAGGQDWARQMAVENAGRAGDGEMEEALLAAGTLHGEANAVWPSVLRRASPYSHYADWLADDPAYWRRVSPHAALDGIIPDVPVLHIGGWHDIMLAGTLAAHRAFSEKASRQRLLVGPWTHIPWGRRSGVLDCGPDAGHGVDTEIVAFFDEVLKGRENRSAIVQLYDAGIKGWRDFHALPQPEPAPLFLASSGRAAPTTGDGRLWMAPGEPARDHLLHDPWRPAPSHGLHLDVPAGFAERSLIDDRGDVAVYTSPPLGQPATLCGAAVLELFLSSDRPSCDVHAVLGMVTPEGMAIAITSGYLHLPNGPPSGTTRLQLRPTMMTVPAGHRLRLSVQAAAFPAFPINPGTGVRPQDGRSADALVTTLVLSLGRDLPSRLDLPLITGSALAFQETP